MENKETQLDKNAETQLDNNEIKTKPEEQGQTEAEETTNTQPEASKQGSNELEDKTKVKPKADKNKLLRELSKEYGVNLFDAKGIEEFKQYQEDKMTELEKAQLKLKEYEVKEQTYQQELEAAKLNTVKVKHNIDEARFNDFITIAKAQVTDDINLDQAIEATLEKYGDTFVTQETRDRRKLGVQVKDKDPRDTEIRTFDDELVAAYFDRKKF